MGEFDRPYQDRLDEESAARVDALLADALLPDALLDADAAPHRADDERSRRVRALFALLSTPVADESARETRLDIAVLRARRSDATEVDRLSPEDARALDAWMDPDADRSGVAHAPRSEQIERLADLAAGGRAFDEQERSARIGRVMRAVEAQAGQPDRTLRFEQGQDLTGWRLRVADLVSIAALLLIGMSVVLPSVNALGDRRERLACMNNMRSSAGAFATYAGDHADMLPMATAGFGGGHWMDVGNRDRSNSANLFTLVRTGYETLDELACAGNAHAARGAPDAGAWDWRSMDEISYSYRIMPTGGLRLSVPVSSADRVIVTADRSPVTLRIAKGLPIIPEASTPNHDGRGQAVLRLDGSARWEIDPVVGGDNIWLPRSIERVIREVRARFGQTLDGTEIPESVEDAFVGP